ncbi:MAG: hypothetical protein WC071_00030 [Victivallaceae bacterium]
MKKSTFLSIMLFVGLFCNIHAEPNVVVDYIPDYYNPLALSLKWHLKYSGMLEKDKKVKITFKINDSGVPVKLPLWEHVLGKSQTECYIYLFLQHNPTGKYTIRIDVIPCERFSNSWRFNHNIPSSYELILATYQKQSFLINKEMLFMKFYEQSQSGESLPDDKMFYQKFTVLQPNHLSDKSIRFLSMEVFCQFTLVDINDQAARRELNKTSLSDMPLSELLQLKNRLEKEFQRGQGSLQQLNAVQQEINNREKRAPKDKAGNRKEPVTK